jgi:hypothetical protein
MISSILNPRADLIELDQIICVPMMVPLTVTCSMKSRIRLALRVVAGGDPYGDDRPASAD